MSRIFITGSSEGLGLMAGQLLAEQGDQVVLHARNRKRTDDARRALPNVEAVVEGDVSTLAGARSVADQVNKLGQFDAVIHNVGVGYREARRIETEDGLPHVFAINVMAPYVLTALIKRPRRLIYLSSGMHHSASAYRRPSMEEPPMGRIDGVCREQAVRRDARLRSGKALAGCAVKLARTRLGANQDGRHRRTR